MATPPSNLNYNAISDPAAWAQTQLLYMGLPNTDANVQFLVAWAAREGGNWNNLAKYNPLNTTEPEPGAGNTGSQGNIKVYTSWEQGIQATAATMQGYPQIMAALQSGNAMSADQSGALAGDFMKWSDGGYGSVGNAPAYGAKTTSMSGSAATPDLSTSSTGGQFLDSTGNTVPTPPSAADIPAMVDYIKQYFGADAWMLNIPGVSTMIENIVAEGRGNDSAYIQGQLQEQPWYQTTSKAVQEYTANKANTPAEYSFTAPGSLAQTTLADVKAEAAKIGVNISNPTAQSLATNVLQYGWDANQLQAALGDTVYYTGTNANPNTNAGTVVQQLQAQAGQYLIPTSDQVLQSWAQGVASGTQTTAQFDAWLKQQASLKWTGMASQIAQGYTPVQIVSNLQQNAAQLMEVSPDSIDFVNDPTYSKILDYVPPDTKDGVHRIMTQSEESQYLKGTKQWSTTQQARDSAATLEQQITSVFGKIG